MIGRQSKDSRAVAGAVIRHSGPAEIRRAALVTFHSFVFVAAPALVFLVANMRQLAVPPSEALRAVAWLALANLALLAALAPWRDLRASAVTLTVFYLALSFYTLGYKLAALTMPLTSEVPVAAGYVVVALSLSLWLGRTPAGADRRYQTLNVAAGTLAAVCTIMLAIESTAIAGRRWEAVTRDLAAKGPRPTVLPEQPPDIYYIVLDGLGRPDVLKERYGVDVSREVDRLRQLGWSIPLDSRANYSQTYLSLASALNGTYVDPIAGVMRDRRDRRALDELIQRAGPIAGLKALGYRFRLIGSNTSVTQRHRLADECDCRAAGLNEFENGLLTITPFRALPLYRATFGSHYASVLTAFDRIMAGRPGAAPQLVLAHVILPHPPFVLDRDGYPVIHRGPLVFGDGDHFPGTLEDYRKGYGEQVRFTMTRLVDLATRLKAGKTPAIVVVHGDHGPGARYSHLSLDNTDVSERLPIFLGMHVEGLSDASMPSNMSPVNTFRLIFNFRFGSRLPLLANRSFYSTWNEPYRLAEVHVR